MAGCPPGGWPQFVGFGRNDALDSAGSLLCVQQLQCNVIENLLIEVPSAPKCVLIS